LFGTFVRRPLRLVGVAAVFLAAILPASSGTAQTLMGRVLDEGTGDPIPGAYLELIERNGETLRSLLSDDVGGFVFSGLLPGPYRIVGERLGYRETVGGFVDLAVGETVELEFRMAVEAILLDPITVTASPRPWYEHMKAPALWEYYERSEYLKTIGRGRFLGPEELRNLSGMPVTMAVGTIPGMHAVQSENSAGRFHLLGRRGCDALFFLNGMPVRLLPPPSRADTADVDFVPGPAALDWFIDDFVNLNDVEAIEVYRGPSELPGEFHGFSGGGNCGAVVVWTRRNVDVIRRNPEG
jgi:hypothetical protein